MLAFLRGSAGRRVVVLLTALVCAVIGLAPVGSARWQLLDDGVTVSGEAARFDSPTSETFRRLGRNAYFHGLYYEGLRRLCGADARGFYVAQAGFFLGSCLLLGLLVGRS